MSLHETPSVFPSSSPEPEAIKTGEMNWGFFSFLNLRYYRAAFFPPMQMDLAVRSARIFHINQTGWYDSQPCGLSCVHPSCSLPVRTPKHRSTRYSQLYVSVRLLCSLVDGSVSQIMNKLHVFLTNPKTDSVML